MNIPFLDKFFESKDSLGCDFGASGMKFVCLTRGNDGLALKSLGMIDADAIGGGEVPMRRVQAYLSEHGLAGCRSAINIEDKTLRIRRMDLPEMPDGDMKIAIKWNFREFVDGGIEKYAVNYSKLETLNDNGGKRSIIAYAVSSESIEQLSKISKQVGLKLVSVEPNATALLSAFDLNVTWEAGKKYAMADLGSRTANFTVMGDGCLLFSRPLSGIIVKHDVAGGTFLGQLAVEMQRSIDAFCLMYGVDKVDKIYMAGGGSLIEGITEHLSKTLGIETVLFNPFSRINTSLSGGNISNPQLYAVAVGLAVPRM